MIKEEEIKLWYSIKERMLKLLERWRDDEIHPMELLKEIEHIVEKEIERMSEYPENHPISIIEEVLTTLDCMVILNIMKEDIPIIIEFLETESGKELEAWRMWDKYWDNIDIDSKDRRKKMLEWIYEYKKKSS